MATTKRVETKVTASSTSAAIAGAVLWVLQHYVFKSHVPAGLVSLIYAVVPAILALIAGYLAPHTPRPAPAAQEAPPPSQEHVYQDR